MVAARIYSLMTTPVYLIIPLLCVSLSFNQVHPGMHASMLKGIKKSRDSVLGIAELCIHWLRKGRGNGRLTLCLSNAGNIVICSPL